MQEMRRLLLLSIIFSVFPLILKAQESEIKGKPIVEIFTDLHINLSPDSLHTTGFSLNRAYFGYDFTLDKNFSSSVIIDIGNPLDLGIGSKSRRYAHFREASVRYTGKNLTLTVGITGTRIFSYQQKFWGKRYVANTYQSINGYGFVADLGAVADYKFNDIVSADVSLTNGEGYSSIQLDNSMKPSLGVTITPLRFLVIRLYSDLMRKAGVLQNTLVGFIGFRSDIFYIGGEVSFKSNLDLTEGHHAWGASSTAGLSISKKNEIFVRYDYSNSVLVPGDIEGWNYERDGTFYIGGLQHTFNQYIQAAIDYQTFHSFDDTKGRADYLFLNVHVKF
jgi:hypothetical protein